MRKEILGIALLSVGFGVHHAHACNGTFQTIRILCDSDCGGDPPSAKAVGLVDAAILQQEACAGDDIYTSQINSNPGGYIENQEWFRVGTNLDRYLKQR